MNCPDWRRLAAHRDAAHALPSDTARWDEAVVHYDSGCPLCRRAALAAEPTLVFRRLRELREPEMSAAQEAAEVDSVRQAVAAMRTASRVDSREGHARRSLRGAGWMRWAAAAGLTVMALTLPASHGGRPPAAAAGRIAPAAASPARTVSPLAPTLPAAALGEADLPTVEGVNRPGARVYHMDGEGMSVVMIVDESLDV
jgi:hypothetical protein